PPSFQVEAYRRAPIAVPLDFLAPIGKTILCAPSSRRCPGRAVTRCVPGRRAAIRVGSGVVPPPWKARGWCGGSRFVKSARRSSVFRSAFHGGLALTVLAVASCGLLADRVDADPAA